jgi:hypothetical protein
MEPIELLFLFMFLFLCGAVTLFVEYKLGCFERTMIRFSKQDKELIYKYCGKPNLANGLWGIKDSVLLGIAKEFNDRKDEMSFEELKTADFIIKQINLAMMSAY